MTVSVSGTAYVKFKIIDINYLSMDTRNNEAQIIVLFKNLVSLSCTKVKSIVKLTASKKSAQDECKALIMVNFMSNKYAIMIMHYR